jgi:uncharacterized protein (TIGR02996 family)
MDDAAFLEQVLQDPDADEPRLIYADWLDDMGSPRGEFIRIQCELAATAPKDQPHSLKLRENELLRENEKRWAGPVSQWVDRFTFHRGFIEFVDVNVVDFLTHAGSLIELTPVRTALISNAEEHLLEFVECKHLNRLTGIGFPFTFLSEDKLKLNHECEHFGNVTRLLLNNCALGDDAFARLVTSALMDQLKWLDVSQNGLTDRGIETLAISSDVSGLESLFISQNEISPTGGRLIAGAKYLDSLQLLDLRGNKLTTREIELIRARFGRQACRF